MDRKAVIYTYSIVYSASEAFKDKTPYVIAVVDDNGNKVLSKIEGYREGQTVAIGTEVVYTRTDTSGSPVYSFA